MWKRAEKILFLGVGDKKVKSKILIKKSKSSKSSKSWYLERVDRKSEKYTKKKKLPQIIKSSSWLRKRVVIKRKWGLILKKWNLIEKSDFDLVKKIDLGPRRSHHNRSLIAHEKRKKGS